MFKGIIRQLNIFYDYVEHKAFNYKIQILLKETKNLDLSKLQSHTKHQIKGCIDEIDRATK